MPSGVHLIPRKRLSNIPNDLRLAHEYCFFLHDESARMLVEYEGAQAHVVKFDFRNKSDSKKFSSISEKENTVAAMRALGYEVEARRVILNQITMAMVSDCLHHIFEALRCFEKRKVIVALNLLRKPLTDNLLYLSWMFGNEDEFYRTFTANSPRGITSSILKSKRSDILAEALSKTAVAGILTSEFVNKALFEQSNPSGLQKLFQHAVHLVTIKRIELETTPENFNFIFKNYEDDDLYELVYDVLPQILLYLSHVILGAFKRVSPPSAGGENAFCVRSILGLYLIEGRENERHAIHSLDKLGVHKCKFCKAKLKLTPHNAARIVLSESYRCVRCQRIHAFPFSWLF